jgi:hypothetical protein
MSDQSTEFARYHAQRAAQERKRAQDAPSDMVRAIHADLANLHESRQAGLGPVIDPD